MVMKTNVNNIVRTLSILMILILLNNCTGKDSININFPKRIVTCPDCKEGRRYLHRSINNKIAIICEVIRCDKCNAFWSVPKNWDETSISEELKNKLDLDHT